MSCTSYEPSGIVISMFSLKRNKICYSIHSNNRVINLKNRQTELVISVTQIYGGKIIRLKDGAFPASA